MYMEFATRPKSNPLRPALLLVTTAALIVITVGGLRAAGFTGWIDSVVGASQTGVLPEDAVLHAAAQPAEGAVPPWPFAGPQLVPDLGELARGAPQMEPEPVDLLPTPTATPPSTATPLPTATVPPEPLATPVPDLVPVQPAVQLAGIRHQWQTWNNCGPATLSMNLSYYGSPLDQTDIGAVLRPYPDDKNVSPWELVDYARSQGYAAHLRVNGSADLARQFLSNGIPLLIETWLEQEPNDGLGHYRLLVGYDDASQRWIGYDSYVHTNLVSQDPTNYQGIYMSYAETDALWKVFQRSYVLIYPPEREPVVRAILGDAFEPAVMWQQAVAAAQAAVAENPDDAFAHFNLGTGLVRLGDYAGAAAAFDRARSIGLPWRMFWYQFEIFEAYEQTGRYAEMVQLADSVNAVTDSIEEIHFWRGRGLAALGDLAGAQAAYTRALQLNPSFTQATEAMAALGLS